MSNEVFFEESQYLGNNRLSFLRRMVLALFCFLSYYLSENSEEAVGSGNLLFFLGLAILVVSAVLVFIVHFRTRVIAGSIILDGLWTTRKVKIDLTSIVSVNLIKYSNFFYNRSVYNLHSKGKIRFYTRGKYCVELVDRDGLKYLIGSQKSSELLLILQTQINKQQ